LTIGQLSKFTEISIHTIRFYESLNLIPKPVRTPKGYRMYDRNYINRVRIIKKFQELGFTLKEIKTISNFDDCKEIKDIARLKLKETKDNIKYFKKLEKQLMKFLQTCPYSGSIDECPIIKIVNKKLKIIKNGNLNILPLKLASNL